jgi:hypothetical protein
MSPSDLPWRRKAVIAMLATALSFAGCQDTRVTNLEKRVDQLEQTTHRLEADRSKAVDDNSARRAKLESCVMEANASFDRDKVNNGTKRRNGTYNVSVPVLEQMQRQKQSKIEECRLLYSK